MSKIKDCVKIVKTKNSTAEILKKLRSDDGYIALLTGGKSFGYTKEILPEHLQRGEILAIPMGGSFNVKYHNGFYYNANNYILQVEENLDTKYLYYWLENKKALIGELYQGWGCKKLKIQSLLNLDIKLPCVLKQKETVKVLDLLASLTKELEVKIFNKDKQCKYYSSEFLQKLLEGKKVEWKALGEALIRTKGTNITANQMKQIDKKNAPLKIFAGGKTVAFVNFNDIPEKDINRKPSIIVKSRGIIEFEFYDKPFSHKNEMWSYHSNNDGINIKYVYYYCKINEAHFQRIASKMQMPQIATPDTDKFEIPIPPMEVQEEVVRILDLLTSHTTQLKAELTARKKQYEYYRNKLLTFNETEAEWKALGEVGDVRDGTHDSPSRQEEGKLLITSKNLKKGCIDFTASYFISYFDFEKINKRSKVDIGDILFSMIGTIGETVIVKEEPEFAIKNMGLIKKLTYPTCEFIYHYLKSKDALMYIQREKSKGSQEFLTLGKLRNLPIPIPPLSKQQEIVEVLDKFDALTSSIVEGLPREIELRQKQYEYYRNLLLLSS